MEKIHKAPLRDEVEQILREIPEAREEDARLYVIVIGNRIDVRTPLVDVMAQVAMGKLPSFETVSRRRREVQREDASLRGSNYEQHQAVEKEMRHEYQHRSGGKHERQLEIGL